MRAAIINLSHPHYNLGACKLATWLRSRGDEVIEFDRDPGMFLVDFDLVCLSAIFSWDVPKGVEPALRGHGYDVWAGGPGFQYMGEWWTSQTRNVAHYGLDWRFERQRGNYRGCFGARGCPHNCHFCGVTPWEGKEYSLDWDFQPRPLLYDNDITDEPVDFQEHIIRRYQETGVQLLDANSGFEPKNFTEETYRRWKPILRGPWRFGYDYLPERASVRRVMTILKAEPSKKKRVYVLVGNEPFDVCLQRANEVVEWGGEPHCQPYLPKAAMDRHDYVIRYDWTPDKLTHFARYFNRWLYKYTPMEEYRCGSKQPFAVLQ